MSNITNIRFKNAPPIKLVEDKKEYGIATVLSGLLSAHVADLFVYISIGMNILLNGAAALVGDPAEALQIDGTALCVAGLGLVAVRLMHNRLILSLAACCSS